MAATKTDAPQATEPAAPPAPPDAPPTTAIGADEPDPPPANQPRPANSLAEAIGELRTRRLVLLGLKDENDRRAAEVAERGVVLQTAIDANRAAIEALSPSG